MIRALASRAVVDNRRRRASACVLIAALLLGAGVHAAGAATLRISANSFVPRFFHFACTYSIDSSGLTCAIAARGPRP